MMKFVDTVTIAKKLHKPFTHVEMPKIFLYNRGGPIIYLISFTKCINSSMLIQ